jgi:penicillin-binding protein 1A
VRLVRVDAETGLLPGPATRVAILEAFMPGTEPTVTSAAQRLPWPENGGAAQPRPRPPNTPQTGGLY